MTLTTLSEEHQKWIDCYCWFYPRLEQSDRIVFNDLLLRFLNEITFNGKGIEITDEHKIAIGGWATLLILRRPLGFHWFSTIESVK